MWPSTNLTPIKNAARSSVQKSVNLKCLSTHPKRLKTFRYSRTVTYITRQQTDSSTVRCVTNTWMKWHPHMLWPPTRTAPWRWLWIVVETYSSAFIFRNWWRTGLYDQLHSLYDRLHGRCTTSAINILWVTATHYRTFQQLLLYVLVLFVWPVYRWARQSLFSKTSRPALGPIQPLVQCIE
jgi:hypothetical protein